MADRSQETRPSGRSMKALLLLLRVGEWTKNLFVFAPLLFSGRLYDPVALRSILLVFTAFCAVSSSLYIVNDLHDAAWDREYPVKHIRPLAARLISPVAAGALASGLLVIGCSALAAGRVPVLVWIVVAGYVLLNLLYTFYLKEKVIADVLTIAVGFVLRVLAGGAAIGVAVTSWLLLCTFLLATFLGFSKRRHELVVLGNASTRHRSVLRFYSEPFLDHVSTLTLAMTLTCYVLYTIAPETIRRFGAEALVYSSLIVMFALFRYLFLIYVKKLGSPTEILYHDRQIVLAILAWTLYVILVLYTWPVLTAKGP